MTFYVVYFFMFFRDGTSKLWHVGSGVVIDDLIKFNPTTSINCCSISSPKNINLGNRNKPVCKYYHWILMYFFFTSHIGEILFSFGQPILESI